MSGHASEPPGQLSPATIVPAWAAPGNVGALFTTRHGGVSDGPWAGSDGGRGLNLGAHCGDQPQRVEQNRRLVSRQICMPIRWLSQVHGAKVIEVDESSRAEALGQAAAAESADAQLTMVPGVALGVLVADCLPVLLADRRGSIVGIAHAGWRGLAGGVLENTIEAMRLRRPDADIVAWLGPCIGPDAFEVGEDVVDAFVRQDPAAAARFRQGQRAGKWWADLAGLAGLRLARAGVSAVSALGACTVTDRDRFWSYRRDGVCGRMAGLIWLQH